MVISSIEVLERMSNQQVFDMVVEHLLTQCEQSAEPNDCGEISCVYRCIDGKMCAAGIFIPDDLYQHAMEGLPWDDVVSQFNGMTHTHMGLISEMQHIHDKSGPDMWERELRRYALMHHLEFNH